MLEDNSNPFMQLLQEAIGGSSYQRSLASNAQQLQQADAASEAATAAQVNLSNTVNKQQLEGDFAAQEEGRKVKAMMGGDAADPNYLIGILTQEYQDNTRAAIAERKQIDKMDSTSIISSPLQWLVNQFTVNDVIDRHNFHAQAADESAQAINQISVVTSNAAQMAKSTAQVATRESIAAKLEAQTQAGMATIAQLKQQNLMHETNAIQALQQGRIQETQQYYAAENHRMQLAEFARAGEKFAWEQEASADMRTMRKLQLDMHMEEWNAKQDEKARILADEQQAEEIINLGAKAIGYTGDLSKTSIKQMQSNPEMKKVFDNIFWAGYNKFSLGKTVIAGTPGEAVTVLGQAKTAGSWLSTPARPTVEYLNSLAEKSKTSDAFVGAKSAAEQLIASENFINKQSKTDSLLWTKNAEQTGSQYAAPNLDIVMAAIPAVADTALHNKVLAPLVAASGGSELTSDRVIGAVTAAIDTGKLSEAQAAKEVADLYTAVMATNNVNKQFTAFGIPAQQSYNIKISDSFFGVGEERYIDLSKPEQVLKYLHFKRFFQVVSGDIAKIPSLFK